MTFQVYPQWNVYQYYLVNTVHRSLKEDAMENTEPITFPVDSPESINSLFGDESYDKGK